MPHKETNSRTISGKNGVVVVAHNGIGGHCNVVDAVPGADVEALAVSWSSQKQHLLFDGRRQARHTP